MSHCEDVYNLYSFIELYTELCNCLKCNMHDLIKLAKLLLINSWLYYNKNKICCIMEKNQCKIRAK